MISKHPRLAFFGMNGCVKDSVGQIVPDTVAIISIHTMLMRTVKSLASFVLTQGLHGL